MAFVLDNNYLAITAIVTVIYQSCFFCVAVLFKIDKVTDFAGTTNFVVLAWLTAILKGEWATRQIVLTLLVTAWGLRLGIFLLLRILAWGEDKRFDTIRDHILSLAGFWFIQALWVWVVSLPVTFVNSSSRDPPIGAADVVGWVLFAIGLAVEATADQQKLTFKNSPAGKGRWCDAGVWKWSRHPNYFGEILLWWGIFVAATPVLRGGQWSAICSPLFTTLVLLFVSGVPMLEASADKKYGGREDYRAYKASTSPLVPVPPSFYKDLPNVVKLVLFLELPLYTKSSSGLTESMRDPGQEDSASTPGS